MSKGTLWTVLSAATMLALSACGGGGSGGESKPKPVNWREIDSLGVHMKIPDVFVKSKTGAADSDQYIHKKHSTAVFISIETLTMPEGGLEAVYREEYAKRANETRRRKKSNDAYIFHKKKQDITLDGKKAFELEQEFFTGTGDTKARSVEVNVDLGNGKLLTLKWQVEGIEEIDWDKMYNRYFKESRASVKLK